MPPHTKKPTAERDARCALAQAADEIEEARAAREKTRQQARPRPDKGEAVRGAGRRREDRRGAARRRR